MDTKENEILIKILKQILKDYKYKVKNTVNNQKIKKYTMFIEFLEKKIKTEEAILLKILKKERDE